ncbi:MAG: 50S ribosomal protein L29 [Desulfurococcaceae archaeon]
MKASEIRRMGPEERLARLNEMRMELLKLRYQARVGTLTNTAKIRNVRRDIARILTVMREEELAASKGAEKAASEGAKQGEGNEVEHNIS